MILSIAEDIRETPFPFDDPCNEEERSSLVKQEERVDEGLEEVESALVQVQTVIGKFNLEMEKKQKTLTLITFRSNS